MSWILRANGMGRARVSERERGSKEKEKPSGLRQIGGKLSEKWEKKSSLANGWGYGPYLPHEMWAPQLNETRFTKEEGFWTSN